MVEYPSGLWKDYALLDSGRGLKLERFGQYVLARPEPKALWDPSLSEREWNSLAHVRFKPGAGFGKAGKEDAGTWVKLKPMQDQWYVQYPGQGFKLRMRLGLTSFKHVGIFPEQAPNWEYIFRKSSERQSVPASRGLGDGGPQAPAGLSGAKVLNLFAYTGGASLAAKAAGADVTHLDSVRQVVSWARGNMENSGLGGIRWIVEDAMKFVRREVSRGHLYDGIILDPPAYGHGPDGERWKLDELLFGMLRGVSSILNPEHGWMVLNLYSNGYSAALGETVVREAFGLSSVPGGSESAPDGYDGAVQSGASEGASEKAEGNVPGASEGASKGTQDLRGKSAAAPDGYDGVVQSGTCDGASEKADVPGVRNDTDTVGPGVRKGGRPQQGYRMQSGELALVDKFGKALPLSIFVRLER